MVDVDVSYGYFAHVIHLANKADVFYDGLAEFRVSPWSRLSETEHCPVFRNGNLWEGRMVVTLKCHFFIIIFFCKKSDSFTVIIQFKRISPFSLYFSDFLNRSMPNLHVCSECRLGVTKILCTTKEMGKKGKKGGFWQLIALYGIIERWGIWYNYQMMWLLCVLH